MAIAMLDTNGHIDLKQLGPMLLGNIVANNADPDARLAWELERNKEARSVPMDSPIPVPPPLNPDGSEQQAAPVRESGEPAWLIVPEDVLNLLAVEDFPPG
jgi:hypothetical protein